MQYPQEFWDARYNAEDYVYGTEPNRYFQHVLDQQPTAGRLLLLSEGEGRNAVYAASKGWKVTAVDFSEAGREKALALAAAQQVDLEYFVMDVRDFDIVVKGPWDMIGLIYAHFPSGYRLDIHQKCAEALRPGGVLVLECFRKEQVNRTSGGPKDPEMLYSKILLESDFHALERKEVQEATIELTEGSGHVGAAEVLQAWMTKN